MYYVQCTIYNVRLARRRCTDDCSCLDSLTIFREGSEQQGQDSGEGGEQGAGEEGAAAPPDGSQTAAGTEAVDSSDNLLSAITGGLGVLS